MNRAKVRDVKPVISRLYASINGFETLHSDDGRRTSSRSATYGELTPRGAEDLIEFLQMTEQDVFYDLGCGVGKVVLQVALSVPVRKSVGIEFIPSRYRAARRVLRAARSEGIIQSRLTSIRGENFLESNLSDATVVYSCATCFTAYQMARLARKLAMLETNLTLVSLQKFTRNHRGFEFIRTLDLQATWTSSAEAYVYRVGR